MPTSPVDPVILWMIIVGIGIGTFALRLSFIEAFTWLGTMPSGSERILRFVPPAVMAALVTPALLVMDGSIAVSVGNDRLLAGLVATAVAWRTRSVLMTIAVGMGTIWTLSFLL